MTSDARWGAISDRNDRIEASRPHVYGGDVGISSLRAFRRYHKDATYDLADSGGVLRWVTQKQMRVYAIIARISLSPDGRAKMVDIAVEAQCHPTTVSRTILKVQAWGLYAVDIRKGRNGGITVWRVAGDRFAMYVKAARQKLRELAIRARIKVASIIQGEERMGNRFDQETVGLHSGTHNVMDAAFSAEYLYHEGKRALKDQLAAGDEAFNVYLATTKLGKFGLRVLEERRRLAIEDPVGEADSVRPVWG